MYQIDRKKNDLIKLEEREFGALGFKERQHLQEWIVKHPDILGEELLIIQKEYAGFNDTKERLDLLALDKEGRLVIIENKLDDTGRDVTWQALKYTSYCSTMTTPQVIKVFQEYLNASAAKGDAKEVLMEFLGLEDEAELLLNTKDQRIMFVANTFRKEVTSTVLWLINHDIDIQCFRATPFSRGEDLFLQVEQIIPVPETAEYMIETKEKEKEERSESQAAAQTSALLTEFWGQLKAELSKQDFDLLDRVTPKGYYSIGAWVGGGYFGFCIGKQGLRVELYFGQDKDKKWFDAMHARKAAIEAKFDGELVWERLDTKTASRIKHEIRYEDLPPEHRKFKNKDSWKYWIEWYADRMVKFHAALLPEWQKING